MKKINIPWRGGVQSMSNIGQEEVNMKIIIQEGLIKEKVPSSTEPRVHPFASPIQKSQQSTPMSVTH